jgi:hypothetical protein
LLSTGGLEMKQIVLTLCILLSLGIVANAACYKCKTSKGTVFTDSPLQDADCEMLAKCNNTYSEALERQLKSKDEAQDRETAARRRNEEKEKIKINAEIKHQKAIADQKQRYADYKKSYYYRQVKKSDDKRMRSFIKRRYGSSFSYDPL